MAFKKTIQAESISDYKVKQDMSDNKSVIRREFDLAKNHYDSAVAVFVSDWHIGTVDFDMEEAIKVIDYTLKTPNAIMFCLGDMLNSAILNSVSDMFEDIAYPQEQWQLFVDLFKEVAKQNKLAVIHTGNHERRIQKQTGIDPVHQAAVSLDAEQAHAPYYAETFIKIKCPQAKDGTFSIPIVTHHGDGGNPEAFSDIDKDSLINSMGHTHNMQVWVKTRLTYDGTTNTNVKKEELNIILPANGGGLYGNAKGYKKAHKSPYLALDLTTAKNPRFDYYKNNDHIEMPIVLATRSFNILSRANTAQKDAIVNNAKKQIERNKKITQIKMLAQLKDLIELLEQYGLETTEDVKHAIEKQIIKCGQTKNKTQNLAPINSDEFTLE